MAFKMKGYNYPGKGPLKKKDDEFGKIKKGEFPNLVEDVSKVQKDKKGLYTTGLSGGTGHHTESDTTRYPKGFADYKGPVKEGDYIDETTHDAWMGVDVEDHSKKAQYEGQPATGKRKVYDKKKKKYVDYKATPMKKEKAKALRPNPPKDGLKPRAKTVTLYGPKMPRSATGKEFDKAFGVARKAGKKTFTWKGKSYNTKLA